MATLKQKLIQLAMTYPTPKMSLPLRIQAMVRESVVDAVEKGTVTSQEAVRGSVQNCMAMYEEMYNKGYLRGIIEEDQRAAQQPPPLRGQHVLRKELSSLPLTRRRPAPR